MSPVAQPGVGDRVARVEISAGGRRADPETRPVPKLVAVLAELRFDARVLANLWPIL
jgi:hypothetical protein